MCHYSTFLFTAINLKYVKIEKKDYNMQMRQHMLYCNRPIIFLVVLLARFDDCDPVWKFMFFLKSYNNTNKMIRK